MSSSSSTIETSSAEEKTTTTTLNEILNLVTSLNLDDFRVAHIDLNNINHDNLGLIVKIATHCCLNGPIGVNKEITLFELNKNTISSLFPTKITNKAWLGFCNEIANSLIRSGKNLKGFFTVDQFGNPWPICNDAFNKFRSEFGTVSRTVTNKM